MSDTWMMLLVFPVLLLIQEVTMSPMKKYGVKTVFLIIVHTVIYECNQCDAANVRLICLLFRLQSLQKWRCNYHFLFSACYTNKDFNNQYLVHCLYRVCENDVTEMRTTLNGWLWMKIMYFLLYIMLMTLLICLWLQWHLNNISIYGAYKFQVKNFALFLKNK